MDEVAVLTVIYPGTEVFLYDFIKSLEKQTYKDFVLVIVNDYSHYDINNLFHNFKYHELNGFKTPALNREIGINYILSHGFKKIILCDIDDTFSSNRFEISVKKLNQYDIVVNDVNIVDIKENLLIPNYFSNRIDEHTNIDFKFILNKNILGLSNTAFKTAIIDHISFPENLKIVDWYLYTILLQRGANVHFINTAFTNYRQHDNNCIGINSFDIDSFKKLSILKNEHFYYLSKIDCLYEKYYQKSKKLLLLNDDKIQDIINNYKFVTQYPLWWEIINL